MGSSVAHLMFTRAFRYFKLQWEVEWHAVTLLSVLTLVYWAPLRLIQSTWSPEASG